MKDEAELEEKEVKPLSEHLEDLRRVLLKSVIAVGVGTFACFYFAGPIVHVLERPFFDMLRSTGQGEGAVLVSLKPAEVFMVSCKAALAAAIILTSPYVLYQLWTFVSPGLTGKERRVVIPILASALIFSLIGIAFCYFFVLRLCLAFFWNYSNYMGVKQQWTIGSYLSFAVTLLVAFAIAFEMPVAAALLAKFNLVRSRWLAGKRLHAALVIFIVAAILTPPDVVSQLLLAFPMLGLYELSILAARLLETREGEK